MTANDITYKIIVCVFNVYNQLGPGLLECVYDEALLHELAKAKLEVKSQVEVPIIYNGITLSNSLRIDILVNDTVILELKSVEELKKVHYKQLQTYLKLTGCKLGLLINFNTDNIQDGIHRIAM